MKTMSDWNEEECRIGISWQRREERDKHNWEREKAFTVYRCEASTSTYEDKLHTNYLGSWTHLLSHQRQCNTRENQSRPLNKHIPRKPHVSEAAPETSSAVQYPPLLHILSRVPNFSDPIHVASLLSHQKQSSRALTNEPSSPHPSVFRVSVPPHTPRRHAATPPHPTFVPSSDIRASPICIPLPPRYLCNQPSRSGVYGV
ncbi:hypothetical protein EJ04DRAFT_610276 [Polyplosphaeria fusca]|uniref:Uncharacterized protein n=1 Tax=Polyplosphaeria fusca TaxID=682080 RepID=A0A9P4QVC9_9PLEO|nr:hypothetical protein EJ04DRAFT_610276 [Polyplosphaeria fusca]